VAQPISSSPKIKIDEIFIIAPYVSLIIAEVFRNSPMLLANRPVEVRTLRDPEISILDTGQHRKDFIVTLKRPGSRTTEPDRATFSIWQHPSQGRIITAKTGLNSIVY